MNSVGFKPCVTEFADEGLDKLQGAGEGGAHDRCSLESFVLGFLGVTIMDQRLGNNVEFFDGEVFGEVAVWGVHIHPIIPQNLERSAGIEPAWNSLEG